MIIGVFFPFDGVVVILMTFAYFLCPESVLGRKTEHGRMVLCALSLYAIILMLLHFAFYKEFEIVAARNIISLLCATPVLLFTHLLYPYKRELRNRKVTFFATFISVAEILVILTVWALVIMSEM